MVCLQESPVATRVHARYALVEIPQDSHSTPLLRLGIFVGSKGVLEQYKIMSDGPSPNLHQHLKYNGMKWFCPLKASTSLLVHYIYIHIIYT